MTHSDDHLRNDARRDTTTGPAHPAPGTSREGSSAPVEVKRDDDTMRDSFIGTEHRRRASNVSWGAIFAGVVTFLAVMVVFGLITAALGLSEASGVVVGIWSVIAMLLSLAVAGFVAGALAVRAGLLHGLLTWATSLVGLLVLVGWLGASILGTVGGALGGIAQTAASTTNVSPTQIDQAAEDIDQQDVEQAQEQADQAAQDAQRRFEQNQDEIAAGAWWGVAGLVLGAGVAAVTGTVGARSAHTRDTEVVRGTDR